MAPSVFQWHAGSNSLCKVLLQCDLSIGISCSVIMQCIDLAHDVGLSLVGERQSSNLHGVV